MSYKTIDVETTQQLNHLYEGDALTFEGFDISDANLRALIKWLEDKEAKPKENLSIYITRGSYMNREYCLTGDNAYPDDLHIVSIDLDDLGNWGAIILPRLELRGRWFSDIVENNRRREDEKRGEV